jgi:hypothetical protein
MTNSSMRPVLLSLSLCSLLWVGNASADPSPADRESARSLLKEGDRLFAAKDFGGALKAYAGADALMHVPSTSVEVAKAQASLGRLIEARETCLQVARQTPPKSEPRAMTLARKRCEELSRTAEPRIPSLKIQVKGPTAPAEIAIDGVVIPAGAAGLPRRLDPGKHAVVVRAAGFAEKSQDVTLKEAESASLEVKLEPAADTGVPPPPPVAVVEPPPAQSAPPSQAAPQPHDEPVAARAAGGGLPTYAWVGFGVAGVGVAVGTVTGLMSLGAASDAKKLCTGNACLPAAQSKIDSSITFANISNVGFAAGIVGAAIGVVGWLTHRSPEAAPPHARIEPWVGRDGGGLRGTF